jgi:hypothetical protein
VVLHDRKAATLYHPVSKQPPNLPETLNANSPLREEPMNLTLNLHPGELSIVRLSPNAGLPAWLDLTARPLVSVAFTANELSVVCPATLVPSGHRSEGPWRAFEIEGPIEFALTGVLASVLDPLAGAGLSIFAVSTYDTDWILVRAEKLAAAQAALAAHFQIREA